MSALSLIGLRPDEIDWARQLIRLLRHPDPVVVELSHWSLEHLQSVADRSDALEAKT